MEGRGYFLCYVLFPFYIKQRVWVRNLLGEEREGIFLLRVYLMRIFERIALLVQFIIYVYTQRVRRIFGREVLEYFYLVNDGSWQFSRMSVEPIPECHIDFIEVGIILLLFSLCRSENNRLI